MKANIGRSDKLIRISLGLLFIAGGIYYQSWWGAIGLIPLFTSTINWCPLYALLGISTKEKETQTN